MEAHYNEINVLYMCTIQEVRSKSQSLEFHHVCEYRIGNYSSKSFGLVVYMLCIGGKILVGISTDLMETTFKLYLLPQIPFYMLFFSLFCFLLVLCICMLDGVVVSQIYIFLDNKF